MKRIFLIVLGVITLISCKKETGELEPALTFTVNARALGDQPFTLAPPRSNSSGSFSYESSDPAVASINGSTVTILGVGSTTITATQASTDDFTEASISATLEVVPAGTYVLGQAIPGGIVFYINATGLHGYMISDIDVAVSAPWTPESLTTTGATGTALGTGSVNTDKIITAFGEGYYAAKACRNYRGGGFDDWYLPSSSELSIVRLRKDIIGGINDTNYWTSSEVAATVTNANFIYMGPGTLNGTTVTTHNYNKSYQYSVRAIREF